MRVVYIYINTEVELPYKDLWIGKVFPYVVYVDGGKIYELKKAPEHVKMWWAVHFFIVLELISSRVPL